jgi:4-amino-4-deoxy-L-arabinose transferase-like glycosyltransferase
MTFFRKSIMSRADLLIPVAAFLILWIHGAVLGLTDDEAYYWVLAQKPSLAYAFHPPAVAWVIGISQALFGWLLGAHSAAMVRLPAAALTGGILAVAMDWLKVAGVDNDRQWKSGLLLVSFAGFFSLAWMMVPDLPLFLGWTLAFSATWKICFPSEPASAGSWHRHGLILAFGMAL